MWVDRMLLYVPACDVLSVNLNNRMSPYVHVCAPICVSVCACISMYMCYCLYVWTIALVIYFSIITSILLQVCMCVCFSDALRVLIWTIAFVIRLFILLMHIFFHHVLAYDRARKFICACVRVFVFNVMRWVFLLNWIVFIYLHLFIYLLFFSIMSLK